MSRSEPFRFKVRLERLIGCMAGFIFVSFANFTFRILIVLMKAKILHMILAVLSLDTREICEMGLVVGKGLWREDNLLVQIIAVRLCAAPLDVINQAGVPSESVSDG